MLTLHLLPRYPPTPAGTLAVPTIHTLGLVTSPWFPLFNPLLPIHIK
jgi:hypothetical protein